MRLNNPLVTSITFKNEIYPLNLYFNRVLDVVEILERKDILQTDKLQGIIRLLIGPNDLTYVDQTHLWSIILNQYINLGAKQYIKYDLDGNEMPFVDEASDTVMDLNQDAKYIYASFRQIGINLFEEQNKMHWEEFQALLESLPDDTIMQKIIQIRLWKPQKGDSGKYKESMRKAQARYQLVKVGEIDDE